MTTLKVNKTGAVKTPTQEIIEDANRIIYVTDVLGRKLGVRKISMSHRRRIFKALSAESQEKDRYVNLCVVAAAVCEIDGEEIAFPSNEMRFDALIDRLGNEGEAAIAKAYREFLETMPTDAEVEAKN